MEAAGVQHCAVANLEIHRMDTSRTRLNFHSRRDGPEDSPHPNYVCHPASPTVRGYCRGVATLTDARDVIVLRNAKSITACGDATGHIKQRSNSGRARSAA